MTSVNRFPVRSRILHWLTAILVFAALLIGFDLVTYLLGRDVVPGFMVEAYKSARASNALVLFFIAVVIVAPVSEEVAFRGFLFRGLGASWLGVSGTLIATSAACTLASAKPR